MNYGNIKECDIADGPGVRVSLFVSGCRHHCKGCFNAETWDFGFGQRYTEEKVDLNDPAQQAAAQHDTRETAAQQHHEPIVKDKLPGRNDPCPCGSGKKFKNCHGKGLV